MQHIKAHLFIALPAIDPESKEAPLDREELHRYYKQFIKKRARKLAELIDFEFSDSY